MAGTRSEQGSIDSAVAWLMHAARPISRIGGIVIGLAIVILVCAADAAMGPKVQLTAMYVLGPIVAAWCSTRGDAVWVSLVSAFSSVAVHVATGSLAAEGAALALTVLLRFLATAAIAVLVSEVRATTERLEELSMNDALTSLLNRRALFERLEVELSRSRRSSTSLSLMYADVDLFKDVNDRFGHAVGDELLIRIAETLKLTVRPTDIVARMGGDEFVVVLPETDEEGARALAARITAELAELQVTYGTGLSLGIAAFATAPDSAEAALHAADMDMYEAKRARDGVTRG